MNMRLIVANVPTVPELRNFMNNSTKPCYGLSPHIHEKSSFGRLVCVWNYDHAVKAEHPVEEG